MRILGVQVMDPVASLRSWKLMSSSYGGKIVKCLYKLYVVSELDLYMDVLNAIRCDERGGEGKRGEEEITWLCLCTACDVDPHVPPPVTIFAGLLAPSFP